MTEQTETENMDFTDGSTEDYNEDYATKAEEMATRTRDKLERIVRVYYSRMDSMRELLKTQGSSGNWDFSEYMLGMYNGMELMMATIEGRDPEFRTEPDEYIGLKKYEDGSWVHEAPKHLGTHM
jgi:hypothetical protein